MLANHTLHCSRSSNDEQACFLDLQIGISQRRFANLQPGNNVIHLIGELRNELSSRLSARHAQTLSCPE